MNDSEFDRMLKKSHPAIDLPAGFRRDVWKAIEAAQIAPARLNPFAALLAWVARPAWATLVIAFSISLGLWLGQNSNAPSSDGQLAYINSVNPFAHSGPALLP